MLPLLPRPLDEGGDAAANAAKDVDWAEAVIVGNSDAAGPEDSGRNCEETPAIASAADTKSDKAE